MPQRGARCDPGSLWAPAQRKGDAAVGSGDLPEKDHLHLALARCSPAENVASRPVARLVALQVAVKRSAEAVQVVVPAGRQVLVIRSARAALLVPLSVKRSGSIRNVFAVPAHSPLAPLGMA